MAGYGYYVSGAWLETHGPDADPSHDPYDCFACSGTGELEKLELGWPVLCDCWCHLSKDEREYFTAGEAEEAADMNRIAREWRDFDTDPPGS